MPLPPPSDPSQPAPLPSAKLTPNIPANTPKKGVDPLILLGVIGFLVVVIIGLIIWGSSQASTAKKEKDSAQARYDSGLAEGKEQQRAEDQAAFFAEQNAEYRTYKAPDAYGGFEIGFPRAWSFYLTAESGDQISGLANPDLVDNTGEKRYGLRFGLRTTKFVEIKQQYEQKMKVRNSGITSQTITVSGIESIQYTGNLDGNKAGIKGSIVLIPVRDKTFYLRTDRYDGYKDEFAKILSSTKVFP